MLTVHCVLQPDYKNHKYYHHKGHRQPLLVIFVHTPPVVTKTRPLQAGIAECRDNGISSNTGHVYYPTKNCTH